MNGGREASTDVNRLVAILMDLPAQERFACALYFAAPGRTVTSAEEAARKSGLTAGEFRAVRAKVRGKYFAQ
jgi:hypothetical protein